ncbi:DUF302 domain-containing protein [bacterium]|nr:DUF302 domain-containing protein [bacterium]MBU1995480.1 DUF302 domain-containing protein [bacterium]
MDKKAISVGIILGVVFGALFVALALKFAAPSILFKEVRVAYSFEKTVEILSKRINAQEGWHVTDVIDQQAEILKHVAEDAGKVKIIKFCNAKYSSQMLRSDNSKFMSVKMPLSISVYEKSDGRVFIGLSNGYVMARLFSGTEEGLIMEKVIKDMESILSFLHFRYTIF